MAGCQRVKEVAHFEVSLGIFFPKKKYQNVGGHNFLNFKYFFDRIEDSERSRSEFSKSSTRLKKY